MARLYLFVAKFLLQSMAKKGFFMQILRSKWLILGGCEVVENGVLVFDSHIHFAGSFDEFQKWQESLKSQSQAKALLKTLQSTSQVKLNNAVVSPAFVNAHLHFEFSANKGLLKYGEFVPWLKSIINHSKDLISQDAISSAISSVLRSGTASVGAVSSFGAELSLLSQSPLRGVFFCELLGSAKERSKSAWEDFLARFELAKKSLDKDLKAGVSAHAPYSINPELLSLLCDFARKNGLICSTHFLESSDEREWLERGSGRFRQHLKSFVPNPKPMYKIEQYLEHFNGIQTLFTHGVYANLSELERLSKNGFSLTHCASSNRLLGKKALNLNNIKRAKLNLSIGTDGLSSAPSLSMLDELRNAIFTHASIDLDKLVKQLFSAATIGGARALGLNSGELGSGLLADVAVFAPQGCEQWDKEQVLLKTILYSKEAKELYIGGKAVDLQGNKA